MSLVTLVVSLVGGPPWGFRVAQQHGEPPFVSQVLPEGRAYNERIRPGDFIEGVNGEDCAFASEVHEKMRNAKGMLRLRLKRLSGRAQRLPPSTQLDPDNVSTPESSAPPTPSSEIFLNRAAKPPLHTYNGGMRGSAQEKKKFFEMAIARQTQALPSSIYFENPDRIKYQSNSAISDFGTDVSGCDSVAGDYCDRSQDKHFYNNDNQSLMDGAKTPVAFNLNQNNLGQALRARSTTPLAIRLTEDRQPLLPFENQPNNASCRSALMSDEYGCSSTGQNMCDTPADIGEGSFVEVPPPPPPPPGSKTAISNTTKRWSIRVDENSSTKPTSVITSFVKTGKASGEVEVPRPQSVAELRTQIATKLEVRNPAGDSVSPISQVQTSVARQPTQPQHGTLTPSLSMLSLDRIQRGLDAYDQQEYPSTSRRNQFARDYSPTPSLSPFYGRDESSKYSPNSTTTEFPGAYYPTSHLKRQHSHLQLQPEVQHAVLLHPGYENLSLSRQSVSMIDLSTPIEYAPPPASYHNPTYLVSKNDRHLTPSANAELSLSLANNHLLPNSLTEQHDTTGRTPSPSYRDHNNDVVENTTMLERDLTQLSVVSRDVPLSASITKSFSQEPSGNSDQKSAYQCQFETSTEPKSPVTLMTNTASKTFNAPSRELEERLLDNTSDCAPASESQALTSKNNRLAELIQLANESFGGDSGCSQLIDTLWTKTLNSVNYNSPPADTVCRPRSALSLTNGTVMNGYSTLPARGLRGTSVRPRNLADDEKSQWYRQISKEIHHAAPLNSERVISSMPYGEPLDQSMSNLRSATPQSSFDQQSSDIIPQQRRAKSVGRYDAVADMKILDKYSQQRQQLNREINGIDGQSCVDNVKKPTMEEVLQRQRAEKLSEELDDQRSRRHGYFPGAAPDLQNNVQRLGHLLQNTQKITNGFNDASSQCFTPACRAYSRGTVQTCTVLYKFSAQSSRELSLNRGDVVRVYREIDNNWIEGERNGQIGIFPVSYVQINEDPSTSQNRVRALYPFQARNRNELSLKKDEILRRRRDIDANWIEGTNQKGQIGIFPQSYVCHYTDSFENRMDDAQSVTPNRPKTPKIATTSHLSRNISPLSSKKSLDRTQQVQQWKQLRDDFGYSGPARMVPKNSETYRALYSYKPEHSDELELQENDIIFVVEKCDDGWFIGTLLRTGEFGTFPGNYVEKH